MSDANHRLAQVDTHDIVAERPQTVRNDAGSDPELDHTRADDPRREIIGESVPAALSAAGVVVDVGNAIERGPRHLPTVGHPD